MYQGGAGRAAGRARAVDALRGLALAQMAAYHFAWFADDAGLVALDLASLGWRAWQRSIAGTFFLLVGVSLVLARDAPAPRRRARLALLAGGAAVVTATSAVLDPARLTTFGVLHAILLASVLGRPLVRLGPWAAAPGAVALLVALTVADPRLDAPALAWLGLGASPPFAFDFQPFVLWFGVTLLGVAMAWVAPARLWTWDHPALAAPAWLGRWSLLFYMAHVPVLMAVVEVLRRALG